MENQTTSAVESKMGAIFFGLFTFFLAGVLWAAIQNFNSDQIALDASVTQVKSMSSTERQLIAAWVRDNDISIPEGKGYRYLVQEYPERPWLRY